MTPTLEDRVRDAFTRQAERTTIDPAAEFDAQRVASAWAEPGGTGRFQSRSVRPLAVAATVTALLGGLVFASQRVPGQPIGDAAVSPVSIVANPPTVSGLPFEVGIAELPPGWEYADVAETTEFGVGQIDDWSSFLFRNVNTGGVIVVRARPQAQPDYQYAEPEVGLANGGNATFGVDGKEVWMAISGVAADVAIEIAHSLTLDTTENGDVTVALPPGSGFDLDEQRLASTYTPTDGASGMILLTTPNGKAIVELDSRDPKDPTWNHFGTPSQVDGATVYTSDQSVTGEPVGNRIAARVWVGDPADLDAAQRLFVSLRRVDGTSDVVGWDEIQDRIAAKLSDLAVIDTTKVGDLVVTRHRGDSLEAVCATWHDITRCRSNISPMWSDDPESGLSVGLVVDGLWVITGTVNAPASIDAPATPPDPESTIGVWQPTDSGANFVYAVPSAATVHISYQDGPDAQVGYHSMSFDRPIR